MALQKNPIHLLNTDLHKKKKYLSEPGCSRISGIPADISLYRGFRLFFLFLFCFPVPFSDLLLPVQSLFDNAPHNIFRHLPGNIAVYISIPVDHKCGRKG